MSTLSPELSVPCRWQVRGAASPGCSGSKMSLFVPPLFCSLPLHIPEAQKPRLPFVLTCSVDPINTIFVLKRQK